MNIKLILKYKICAQENSSDPADLTTHNKHLQAVFMKLRSDTFSLTRYVLNETIDLLNCIGQYQCYYTEK